MVRALFVTIASSLLAAVEFGEAVMKNDVGPRTRRWFSVMNLSKNQANPDISIDIRARGCKTPPQVTVDVAGETIPWRENERTVAASLSLAAEATRVLRSSRD